MNNRDKPCVAAHTGHGRGWKHLLDGFPCYEGENTFPLPAYSEYMPPPRLGRAPYGTDVDPDLFAADDPYGWHVTEFEEERDLRPGLIYLAERFVDALRRLGEGKPVPHIQGHEGENLENNPCWPENLAAAAGQLKHERYITLLPLALSRTQDYLGRVRWTLFGSSEQGPERAFWQSFRTAPGLERPINDALTFAYALMSRAYGVRVNAPSDLHAAGWRILPSGETRDFPYWWSENLLPSWARNFLVDNAADWNEVRYLLTFRPFSLLPATAQERYLAGKLVLWPFPGSLVFWGMPTYRRLQKELPLAMQIALLRQVKRHGNPRGIRVPQSGWIEIPRSEAPTRPVKGELVVDKIKRISRWARVQRFEDTLDAATREDSVARALFSTKPDAIGLYEKPLARNAQIWTRDFELLLDGTTACRADLDRAEQKLLAGGLFAYRYAHVPMQVGPYAVYWHRPLVAYADRDSSNVETIPDAMFGYLTAYRADAPDPGDSVDLWPRLERRPVYLAAVQRFNDPEHDYYAHQTSLNLLNLLDTWERMGRKPLPRSFARNLLRIANDRTLEAWLDGLLRSASSEEEGRRMRREIEVRLEPPESQLVLPEPITCGSTATRAFEEAYWRDIMTLAHGSYPNTDNADCVRDADTQKLLQHSHRDLEPLGDYLLERHRRAIAAAGLEGKALVGELPFHWRTDFNFPLFGGWTLNQEGKAYERNLLVVIPGRDHGRAIVLADHYDTAYMEDIYEKKSGARLSAAGADDNFSATATLLQAAPVFLDLARAGRLACDIWLLHLTGEEFPSDCMGARHFTEAVIEKRLRLRLADRTERDLSKVQIAGIYVMDMIAHNRADDRDIFQISPGKGEEALRLAWHAHLANEIWNAGARTWNQRPERRGRGRGQRSPDPHTIPAIALHPHLRGEVRTEEDPMSSLFNTDGQIFSDAGLPAVLLMENYDINRKGYHDTRDTAENIDLDYGAAVAAIAIEATAQAATA
jgi:hypothetical protein